MKDLRRIAFCLLFLLMSSAVYSEGGIVTPIISDLRWFPQGNKAIFVVSQKDGTKLVIAGKDGGIIKEIQKNIIGYEISPDGSKVAYYVGADNNELWILSADNLREEIIASGEIRYFYWDKSGENILYTKTNSGRQGVYVIDLATKMETEIFSYALEK